jgi:hypothetical protein
MSRPSLRGLVVRRRRWGLNVRAISAHGDVIFGRFADDCVAGFEHEDDARRSSPSSVNEWQSSGWH